VLSFHFQCIEYNCCRLLARAFASAGWYVCSEETLRLVSSTLGQINISASFSRNSFRTRDQFCVRQLDAALIYVHLKNVSARARARNASCVCHLAGIAGGGAPDYKKGVAKKSRRLIALARRWRKIGVTWQEKLYENPSFAQLIWPRIIKAEERERERERRVL
jgi:hypothetical protein